MQVVAAVKRREPLFVLVNAMSWKPSAAEFDEALVRISDPAYIAGVKRFHKGHADASQCRHWEMPDPKCFVIAHHLYQLAFEGRARELGVSPPVVRRTKEGKPHCGQLGTWLNANASHAGGVVGFVQCEIPGVVCGCDVMPVELAPPAPISIESVDEFFASFQTYFTTAEWQWILSPVVATDLSLSSTAQAQFDAEPSRASHAAFMRLKRFLTLWTLKESIIKAMGIGLGFELQRASFNLSRTDVWSTDFYSPATSVRLALDGHDVDWAFELHERPEWNIVAAVALLPVEATRESSFAHTFQADATACDGAVDLRGQLVTAACLRPEEIIEYAQHTPDAD